MQPYIFWQWGHFDQRFGHAESVREIRAEAANDGAEATPSGSLAGHGGLRKQRPQIPEHRDHWWWVVGLQVRPGNQGAVVTVATFNIPEAKKGQASAEQRQSDVDRFLWFPWGGASQGQNINKEYYLEVLRRLRDAVRRKRPDLWATGTWQLHHDNAPSHSSQLIQTFLAKHDIPVVRQAPYSLDMAPCDFWLFPRPPESAAETDSIWVKKRRYTEHDG